MWGSLWLSAVLLALALSLQGCDTSFFDDEMRVDCEGFGFGSSKGSIDSAELRKPVVVRCNPGLHYIGPELECREGSKVCAESSSHKHPMCATTKGFQSKVVKVSEESMPAGTVIRELEAKSAKIAEESKAALLVTLEGTCQADNSPLATADSSDATVQKFSTDDIQKDGIKVSWFLPIAFSTCVILAVSVRSGALSFNGEHVRRPDPRLLATEALEDGDGESSE